MSTTSDVNAALRRLQGEVDRLTRERDEARATRCAECGVSMGFIASYCRACIEKHGIETEETLHKALAASQAECEKLREALYPLVVGCLTADANEDAPEFVNDEAYVGLRALPECGRCCGSGSTDGTEYVDVAIPEALRCPDCGGWGFLMHPRPPGSREALRAMLMKAVDVAYRQGAKDAADDFPGTVDGEVAAIVARLLPTPQDGAREGEQG